MNKQAVIGDMKISTPFKAWKGATVNPLGSTLAMSALAAIPAYYATPYIARKFVEHAVPEKYRAEVDEEFNKPENQRNLKWKGAGIAAALTGLAHLGVSYNPARRGINSLTSWQAGPEEQAQMDTAAGIPKTGMENKDMLRATMVKQAMQYFLNAPAFGDSRIFGTANGIQGMPPIALNQNTAPLFGMSSSQGFGDTESLLNTPVVPLTHATELIENDPYLNNRQKGVILNIFDHTGEGGRSGLVSASDLASGGIRAGLGYAAGATAGLVLGSIFSLPTKVTQKLSQIGGIANAVVNTGIVGI